MKNKEVIIRLSLVVLAVAFLISCASAASPVLSTVQSGSLEILAPSYNYVTQGEDKDIYWHVFNTTTLLTNTTTSCSYHLYSQKLKGEHIVTVNNVKTFSNGRDFEVEVEGANFSTLGQYCHIIECNTSSQSGGLERCFTVTPFGDTTETEISLLFLLLIFGGLAVAGIFIALAYLLRLESMKNLFISLALMMPIIISQAMISASITYPNIKLIASSSFILSIVAFSLFIAVLLIKYTVYTIKLIKGDKTNTAV
jgi:hypothetical protein